MKEKKKSHGVQLLLRLVVRDPDDKVLSDTGQKPSKSFVIQFLEFIGGLFDAPAQIIATATSGAEDSIYNGAFACSIHFRVDAPVNDDTYGVVVGTGNTAETNTDFKLDVQLTEGVGLGDITHGAQVIGTTAVVGANVDLVNNRAFTNNTGAAITVEEAGIYVKETLDPHYHCIVRDVLPAPVNVPEMCSLDVYYTLRTTV